MEESEVPEDTGFKRVLLLPVFVSLTLVLVMGSPTIKQDELVEKKTVEPAINSNYRGFDDVACVGDAVQDNGFWYADTSTGFGHNITCFIDYKGERPYLEIYDLEIRIYDTPDIFSQPDPEGGENR